MPYVSPTTLPFVPEPVPCDLAARCYKTSLDEYYTAFDALKLEWSIIYTGENHDTGTTLDHWQASINGQTFEHITYPGSRTYVASTRTIHPTTPHIADVLATVYRVDCLMATHSFDEWRERYWGAHNLSHDELQRRYAKHQRTADKLCKALSPEQFATLQKIFETW
jgi:hypothetical protein